MRKPLKFYLFFLVLITLFGILGNILINDEPNLDITDIDKDIPGSEAMVAIYEQLAAVYGEDAVVDVAITPFNDDYIADVLLLAPTTDEQQLLIESANVIELVTTTEPVASLSIEWEQQQSIMTLSLEPKQLATWQQTLEATLLPSIANSYTYTN